MKTKNLYLNSVLTLIAFLLLALLVQNQIILKNMYHEKEGGIVTNETAFRTISNPMNHVALVPVNEDGSIDVRLQQGQIIDVNIDNIDTRDVLNINVEKVDGYAIKNGRVPVKSYQ